MAIPVFQPKAPARTFQPVLAENTGTLKWIVKFLLACLFLLAFSQVIYGEWISAAIMTSSCTTTIVYGWRTWSSISKTKTEGDEQTVFSPSSANTESDDVAGEEAQEELQYLYSMGRPMKTTKVIGREGGIIELLSYKVKYQKNSLKEETKIELSIDNNPYNLPKEGLPITSILNIKPSMKLEVPAIVTMPTTCKAASGKATIQIWSKEEGEDWKRSQTVSLKKKKEITFKVDHFCGIIATSSDGEEENLKFTLKNRVYIQKGTGMLLSVFWLNDVSMEDTVHECIKLEYKRTIPTDLFFTGKLGAEFEVVVECMEPNLQYSPADDGDSVTFEVTAELCKAMIPDSIEFMHSNYDILRSASRIRIKYSVKEIETGFMRRRAFDVLWPIKFRDAPRATNITVDNSQTIAENIADRGSRVKKKADKSKTTITMKKKRH